MKFKGHTLKVNNKEYVLRQQLDEGGFCFIYTTNKPQIICKVQTISQSSIKQAYVNEKNTLNALSHPNIIKLYSFSEEKVGDNEYGFMLLENCSRGSAVNILQKQTSGFLLQKTILKIAFDVASALSYMHSKGIAHRDIKLENVLLSESGTYKLCDFGSSSSQIITVVNNENRATVQEFIEKTTTPYYRSPQQLNLYSGYQIGTEVDIFALGVLCFMLCFKKPPFETRLSAINSQFFLPNEHPYSQGLIKIIQQCFTVNPTKRPTAAIVMNQIRNLLLKKKVQIDLNYEKQLKQTIDQMKLINQKTCKKTSTVQSKFIDKVKILFNQMTTQTQGWITGFIIDNEEPPNLKFNRLIIAKCWEKRYKVEKIYQLLWEKSQQHKSKPLVTLKLLTLLHNFLRKGPVEGLTFEGPHSSIKLCTKIYNHWKQSEKSANNDDMKRNLFVKLLVRLYCLIIIGKIKLCFENSDIFEGNYSIMPYLRSMDDVTILKIPLIQQMLNYMDSCSQFHDILQKYSYLIDIQRTMILSIVDEEYCQVSTLVFILCAFKNAINYVNEDLDMERLKMKVDSIEKQFTTIYTKLHQLFKQTAKLASLLENNQFDLPMKVVSHICDIKIGNFKINEHFKINKFLNYKDNIYGLKIPLTYQEVVKNPNFLKEIDEKVTENEYIQIDDFKVRNSEKEKKQQPNSNGELQISPQSCKKIPKLDYSSFMLDIKQNQKVMNGGHKIEKDGFKTMDFTHQNLYNADPFADFQTIVHEQKKSSINETVNNNLVNTNKQDAPKSTKEIPAKSETIVNFFEDVDLSPSKTSTLPPNEKPSEETKAPQKKQQISLNNQIEIPTQQFSSNKSFIDVKGFIVEQVKKNAEQYIVEYSTLKLKNKIGSGHFSTVFRGEWRGRQVAIKKVTNDMNSPGAEKEFKRQIMTSVKIRHHPHLVTLIGVSQYQNQFYIISEYCHGASLFDLLHQSKALLPWNTRISIAKQIANGMVFLHSSVPPVIHRDLKSLNVLLVNVYSEKHPDNIQIKIADFGLSRDFASVYMTGTLGTYHWMAPQIFSNQPYSLKADVYSFGIVLWEIAARKPPYLNMNPQSIMKLVTVNNGRPDLSELESDCPQVFIKLMTSCWDKLPENRPTFQEILKLLNQI